MSATQTLPGSRVASASSESRIVRYSLDERIHHWMAAITYVYCLTTGLAFWSPYLFWLAALEGGGATARFCSSVVLISPAYQSCQPVSPAAG